MELPAEIVTALKDLVHELVVENYAGLVTDGRAGRLSTGELEFATQRYGVTLVELPDEAFELAYIYPIGDNRWAVDLPLWTTQEGRSDLTLQVSVQLTPQGVLTEIEDLHAM